MAPRVYSRRNKLANKVIIPCHAMPRSPCISLTLRPCRKLHPNLGFCSLVQPTKGKDASDTFKKMLTEIHSVSESVAACIVEHYPCLYDLIRAYRKASSVDDAKKLLADLQASGTLRPCLACLRQSHRGHLLGQKSENSQTAR